MLSKLIYRSAIYTYSIYDYIDIVSSPYREETDSVKKNQLEVISNLLTRAKESYVTVMQTAQGGIGVVQQGGIGVVQGGIGAVQGGIGVVQGGIVAAVSAPLIIQV